MQYFFANGNEQKGPYSIDEMAALGLRPDTLVWHEGMPQWQRADSLPELAAAKAGPAPDPAIVVVPQVPTPQQPTAIDYHIPATTRPTDGMAVASLVLGLISIPALCYGLGFIPGVLAIVFGFIARVRIKRGQSEGATMALVGLICGFVSVLLVVAFVVVVIIIGLRTALSK